MARQQLLLDNTALEIGRASPLYSMAEQSWAASLFYYFFFHSVPVLCEAALQQRTAALLRAVTGRMMKCEFFRLDGMATT